MAYIIVLTRSFLSGSADVAGNKLGFTQVSAMTSLAAGVMTSVPASSHGYRFAFARGLGINSFLAELWSLAHLPEAMALWSSTADHRPAGGDRGCAEWCSTPCRCSSSSPSRPVSDCSSSSSAGRRWIHRLDGSAVTPVGLGHGGNRFDNQHVPTVVFRVHLLVTAPRRAARARRHPRPGSLRALLSR